MKIISPPSKAIDDLMSFIKKNEIPVTKLNSGKRKHINNHSEVIVILDGSVNIYQRTPSYYMGTLVGPVVIGLVEQFHKTLDFNYKITSGNSIYILRASDIKSYMTNNEMLDISLRISCYFNELLATQFQEILLLNAQAKIKLFIRRYIRLEARGAPMCGLCEFIMHRANISRSMVMKVISELKKRR
ncbi:MAG: hypothetical protein ACRDCY_15330 [Aeromonas veronii]